MFLDGNHGDFSCSESVCTIDANAIALGTDTTGDYGSDVTSNQGLAKTGTEAATSLCRWTDGTGVPSAAFCPTTATTEADCLTGSIRMRTADLEVRNSGNLPCWQIESGTAPTGTAPTTAFGQIASDSNAWASGRGALQTSDGTAATFVVATQTSDTPTNGQVPTWNTGGTMTWETPSAGSAVNMVSYQFGCTDATANDNTIYMGANEQHNAACRGSKDERARFISARTRTSTAMACRVQTAPGSGTSNIYTLRDESVDSDLVLRLVA